MDSRGKNKAVRAARGRKMGHALKFHNFYVANERLCQSSSTRRGERTLTHCLREEHGTKQITVSHWTTSPQDHDAKQDQRTQTKTANIIKTGSTSEGIKIPADHQFKTRQHQQSILQSLLANNLLSDSNQSPGPRSHVPGSGSRNLLKVNKRKPLFVRRLLPHPYPCDPAPHGDPDQKRDCAAQDQPLDLTTRKDKKTTGSRGTSGFEARKGRERDPVQHLIQSVEESAAEAASIIASVRGKERRAGVASSCSRCDADHTTDCPASSPCVNHLAAIPAQQQSAATPLSYLDPDFASRGDRNRAVNQRTLIKQKLEDAFRENGFLVKTKQVSDGSATFCKFRQLRKYTRYYLKSWHKHLPDEVNKLYKGFLPPVSDKKSV